MCVCVYHGVASAGSRSDSTKPAISLNLRFFATDVQTISSTMLPLLLLAVAAAAGVAGASDVLEFADDDFESRIGDHDLILVEFFAPW